VKALFPKLEKHRRKPLTDPRKTLSTTKQHRQNPASKTLEKYTFRGFSRSSTLKTG